MNILRSRSGKLPIVIIIAVLLLVCVGGGAFTFLKMSKKPQGGKSAEQKKQDLASWKLDEFIVNLRDTGEQRYLKVNMALEVEGEKPEAKEGENTSEAMARDAIIDVLTSKSFDELQSIDGKSRLKAELKSALNSTLEKTKVVNIYFTSFAMQ